MTWNRIQIKRAVTWIHCVILGLGGLSGLAGCGSWGYQSAALYPDHIDSVRLEMFDNRSFRRNIEYSLTDALAKHIEAQTPYKLISSADIADTVMSGQIVHVYETVLSTERETGKALEKEMNVQAHVTWKDLKTGDLLLDAVLVEASASYSEFLGQGTRYVSHLIANTLAQRIVETMETQW